MRITGFHERESPWYVTEYDLLDVKLEQEPPLGRLDWTDWDSNSDLLFAREGRLYRLEPQRKNGAVDVSAQREVADLRDYVFENMLAPPAVTQWRSPSTPCYRRTCFRDASHIACYVGEEPCPGAMSSACWR